MLLHRETLWFMSQETCSIMVGKAWLCPWWPNPAAAATYKELTNKQKNLQPEAKGDFSNIP